MDVSIRKAKGLSAGQVVSAGLAELDDAGLENLSLRAVARRLDVQPPALYWHVGNKQALLDRIGTELWRPAIMAAVAKGSTGRPNWDDVVLSYARTLRASVTACRDGARVAGSTVLQDPELLDAMEQTLARHAQTGIDIDTVVLMFQTAQHATIGFCLREQSRTATAEQVAERRIQLAATPHVATFSPLTSGSSDERFESMLSFILGTVRETHP